MRRLLFSLLVIFATSVQFATAQSATETFYVRVQIGEDTNPPTTPVLLAAIPIATTQINLNWSSSTDNFMIGGYSILRDGNHIATTTLLNYSDSSLSVNTTYSYTVRAFDNSLNYSSTSNSIATTTLDTLVAPTGAGSIGGTVARIVVEDVKITEGVSTTSLQLKLKHPARIEVRWGKTSAYESGYAINSVYSKDHKIRLTDLEPDSRYVFEIIGYTPHGKALPIKVGYFFTEGVIHTVSPSNVSRFQALRKGDDVDLSWQTLDEKVTRVRIVRSHLSFPNHPQDGAIVYQGSKNYHRDSGILSQYSPVYYTAFAYDTNGNISSGAVALAYALYTPEEAVMKTGNEDTNSMPWNIVRLPVIITEATSSVESKRVTRDMKMPSLSEISVIQGQALYTLLDAGISLDSQTSFLISVPKETVAGNLKSIILTVLDPTDNRQSYSYLLRINKDQTAYEANIAPLKVVGKSQLSLNIYDYEAFVVATYQAPMVLVSAPAEIDGINQTERRTKSVNWYQDVDLIVFLLSLVALMIMLLMFYKRRAEDKK